MNILPLNEEHKKLKAKFAPFSDWNMPVLYTSILTEHKNIRDNCGLFDISHMGIFSVTGKTAYDSIQKIIPNNLDKIQNGKGIYTHLLNSNAGIIDDLIVYMINNQEFILIVNAGNTKKDFNWLKINISSSDTCLKNISDEFGLLAVQGPKSSFLTEIYPELKTLKFFEFIEIHNKYFFRTGYTGDYGFEIMVPISELKDFFLFILEKGESSGLLPAGLGCRDSLRIEAGLPLYGHELTESILLSETNLMWTVDFSKEFIGKEKLKISVDNSKRKLTGFEMIDKGVPRINNKIFCPDTLKEIGYVTSGTFSPVLSKFIGMGYIEKSFEGNTIKIQSGDKVKLAELCKLPFWKKRSSI